MDMACRRVLFGALLSSWNPSGTAWAVTIGDHHPVLLLKLHHLHRLLSYRLIFVPCCTFPDMLGEHPRCNNSPRWGERPSWPWPAPHWCSQ